MRSHLGWTVAAVCAALLWPAGAPAQEKETPSAQATRKRLAKKISVEWDNTPLKVALEDIKNELDGRVSFKIDNVSGVSNNTKVKLKADEQLVTKILDELCTKNDWGYIVLSKAGDRYDGWIIIRKSNERGYEKGKEPKGAGAKDSSAAPPRRALEGAALQAPARAGPERPAFVYRRVRL
jgi:hypothetical protein